MFSQKAAVDHEEEKNDFHLPQKLLAFSEGNQKVTTDKPKSFLHTNQKATATNRKTTPKKQKSPAKTYKITR